jgi:hypothetical protein
MWGRVRALDLSPLRVTLAVALGLLGVGLVLVLSGSPTEVARANGAPAEEPIMQAGTGAGACQGGEAPPAGTTAVRLTLVAILGPRVNVTVSSGGRRVAAGSVGSGWTAGSVTVPIAALSHPLRQARVCFTLGRSVEKVEVGGAASGAGSAARTLTGDALPGRFTVEYMRPAASSWWGSAKTVARRLGVGHAPAGTWLAALLLAAMVAMVGGASWLLLRELA